MFEDIADIIDNAKHIENLEEQNLKLIKALRDIANLNVGDCAKYVKKADSIACECLARIGVDL